MDGPVCLIVNPHAGAGRALKLLPGVEAELRAQGRQFRVERTTSMDHARELARDAAAKGEIVAAMGGDGITGAIAGELRDGNGLLAVFPGGRGNDFARKLEIPFDPAEAAKLLQTGAERRIDLAEVGGLTYLGILSAGFDSDVSRIALETQAQARDVRLHLRGAARDPQLEGSGLGRHDRRRDDVLRRLLRRGLQQRRLRRRDVPRARTPRSRTACSTSC